MAADDESRVMSPQLQSWLGIAGVVAAPITAITALCYYFGYVSTRKRMAYLGVDSEAVGFTTNDYVMQSAGVLYVIALSAAVVCALVLVFGVMYRNLARRGGRHAVLRRAAVLVIGLGAFSLVRGVTGIWVPGAFPDEHGWQTPVALAAGAALLLFGGWMLRTCQAPERPLLPLAQAEWALVGFNAVVLVLALFWTTNVFANKAGEVEGINAVADLWSRNGTVILDTSDRLFLPPELIKETQLADGDARQAPTYRYECFRAIAVRGDRWVLMPANWRPEFGYAVIVTTDASHRITLRSINGAPKRMGGGLNVRDHWPCPELVRTVNGDAVQSQLLALEDVQRLAQLPGLAVAKEYVQRPQPRSTPQSPSCVGAVNATAQEPDPRSGFVQRYGREMQDASSSSRIDESVVEFSSPRQASDFFDEVEARWEACAHTDVAVAGQTETQRIVFGELTDDQGIQTLAMTGPDGECSHATGAISNVVSDVVVCGPHASERASAMAAAIRDRFPI